MPKNKTDNFLKAIQKYAKAQKKAMKGEIAQLKSERIKEAEQQAKQESKQIIKAKLNEKQNEQTARLASNIQEGQRKLFIERVKMTDEVFSMVTDKLKAYTETDAYSAKLNESAKAIAEIFDGKDCVIYLSQSDLDKAEDIKKHFRGNAEVEADITIRIGGVKAYCEQLGIIADETLDSKLEAQREWFCENATLNVG